MFNRRRNDAGSVAKVTSLRLMAYLGALAAISCALYLALARLAPGNGWRDVGLFLAIMGALFIAYAAAFLLSERATSARMPFLIIAAALLFRLALVPAGLPRETRVGDVLPLLGRDLAGAEVVFERQLLYDDDHWRYLWDGHVGASGVEPYAFAPDDPRLDALAPETGVWQEIRQSVNHPWLTTIYPPLTQLAFRALHAIAPGSVVALKLLWIAIDLLTMLLVGKTLIRVGRPTSLLLLYAWNPLLIKSTAGSAHFDGIVALGVALLMCGIVSVRRPAIAAGWIVAVAAKLTPIVFFLPVVRRLGVAWTVASGAAIAALLVPMAGGSGGEAFASDWEFNATFFHGLKLLFAWSDEPGRWARVAVAFSVALAALWAARSFDRVTGAGPVDDLDAFARAALIPMAVLLLCGPVLMPWYVVWVLPLAAVARVLFWFQLTAIVQFAFLVMVDGRERPVVLFLQTLLTLFCVVAWLRQCRRSTAGASS